MKKHKSNYLGFLFLLVFSLACGSSAPAIPVTETSNSTVQQNNSPTPVPSTTDASAGQTSTENATVPSVSHLLIPADVIPAPLKQVDDVDSSGTAPEKRAPYGDSLDLNRFERPFLEDMTYIPDLDIHRFALTWDTDWFYVSIRLIGVDPNNVAGINYGVEIDRNADGYGDYLIWARPPYTSVWDTGTVQVYMDTNTDTGGLNVVRAEDVFQGDGYDKLVFDGRNSQNDDPDLAWVRWNDAPDVTLQFAFKRTLAGDSFMFGVLADAGLKDVSMFDYADRFTPAEAGSPVRGKENFPLGLLYAVDNTCWDAHGFTSTGYEPKVCPPILQPVIEPSGNDQPSGCNPPPNCGGGPYDPNTCECQ